MSTQSNVPRLARLDFLRGVAVLSMVGYHGLFNLAYFAAMPWATTFINQSGVSLVARLIAVVFIVVSGFSLGLFIKKGGEWRLLLSRALKLFVLAMVITITTLIFVSAPIYFGILHFLAVSAVIGFVWYRCLPRWSMLVGGCVMFVIGLWLSQRTWDWWWLMPLGFIPRNFSSLDYFPLFPWLAFFLWGMWLTGEESIKKYLALPLPDNYLVRLIEWCGRHSLFIYLLHQPVLLALLQLAS